MAEVTELPDERLSKRFASSLETFASDPLASIPQATYRFLENAGWLRPQRRSGHAD